MKSEYVAVLLASLLALALAYPGATRESSTEMPEVDDKNDAALLHGVLMVPARHNVFEDGEEDEPLPGYWYPFRFGNPFDHLYTKMQETMTRIRAQMEAALAGQLGQSGLTSTPWGKVPDGANTTSTTKVIGDHAVTINETTYADNGTEFRIRIIDVKPLNETAEAVGCESSGEDEGTEMAKDPSEPVDENREELTSPAPSRSVETAEELDNEIPKNQVDVLTA